MGGEELALSRVDHAERTATVYNLEVAGLHTYFVGRDGWFVHNGGCGKKVPNPGGRRGGKPHQDKVGEVSEQIVDRGNLARTEYHVPTPEGKKTSRFSDVAEIDPGTDEVIAHHQVGRKNKSGPPVKREREAAEDIAAASGDVVIFHPYN